MGSSGCAESGAFGLPGQKLTQSEILAAMKEMDEDGDTQFILPLLAFFCQEKRERNECFFVQVRVR